MIVPAAPPIDEFQMIEVSPQDDLNDPLALDNVKEEETVLVLNVDDRCELNDMLENAIGINFSSLNGDTETVESSAAGSNVRNGNDSNEQNLSIHEEHEYDSLNFGEQNLVENERTDADIEHNDTLRQHSPSLDVNYDDSNASVSAGISNVAIANDPVNSSDRCIVGNEQAHSNIEAIETLRKLTPSIDVSNENSNANVPAVINSVATDTTNDGGQNDCDHNDTVSVRNENPAAFIDDDVELIEPTSEMPRPMETLRHGMVKYEDDDISGKLSYKTTVRLQLQLFTVFLPNCNNFILFFAYRTLEDCTRWIACSFQSVAM